MGTVAIVTDSTVCLPPNEAHELRAVIVPHHLIFEGQDYRDGVDLSARDFYRMLRQVKRPPLTSAPSVGEYVQAYREAAETAETVLCITLPSRLSHAYSAAHSAAEQVSPQIPVHVLDSQTVAAGHTLVVIAAARRARHGDLEAVLGEAAQAIRNVRFAAFLDTLVYARASGRIPGVVAWISSALDLKPLLTVKDGEVRRLGIARTRQGAIVRLLEFARSAVGPEVPVRAVVQHTDAAEEAGRVLAEVQRDHRCLESWLTEFTPVMGAHSGPGVLSLALCPVTEM